MLQEVEHVLGIELFTRSRSGMTATPALVSLLQRLTVIENELQALGADAAVLHSRGRQVYRLGVLPRSMQNYMPQVLAKVVEQHRGLEFSLIEATSDVLLRELSDNRLDCAVARLTRDAVPGKGGRRSFKFEVLYEEGMCVVAGKRHPLAKRKRLTLEDTLQWGWTLPPTGSVTRNLLVDEFLHSGISPPVPVIECASFFSNLSLVEQGTLLTVAPASAARKYASLQGTTILDLKLETPLPPISLIWRAGSPLEGPLAVLRDELRRNCGT
jgi:DNA-binding transcriptional LysR family regulator